MLQTAWSGRIELGAIGDDSFNLHSSLNGTDWTTRLSAQGATGRVGIGGQAPAAQLDVKSLTNNGLRLSSTNTAVGIHNFDSGGEGIMSPVRDFGVMAYGAGATATFRCFPTLNTMGATAFQVLRANGSAAANSALAPTRTAISSSALEMSASTRRAPARSSPWPVMSLRRATICIRWVLLAPLVRRLMQRQAPSPPRTRARRPPSSRSPLGLDFVHPIAPRIFRRRQKGAAASTPEASGYLGLVTQEVKTALDTAGVDCGLFSLDGPFDPDSGQSLSNDQFVAPLIAAIQEKATRLETLGRRSQRA